MRLLGVLFLFLSAGTGVLGARFLLPLWRDDRFARGNSGVRTVGTCVNMHWTTRGHVSSVIAYEDAAGDQRLTGTGPHRTIPVHLGETADVRYDPRGRARAIVNDEVPPRTVYLLSLAPLAVCLLLGAIGLHQLLA